MATPRRARALTQPRAHSLREYASPPLAAPESACTLTHTFVSLNPSLPVLLLVSQLHHRVPCGLTLFVVALVRATAAAPHSTETHQTSVPMRRA